MTDTITISRQAIIDGLKSKSKDDPLVLIDALKSDDLVTREVALELIYTSVNPLIAAFGVADELLKGSLQPLESTINNELDTDVSNAEKVGFKGVRMSLFENSLFELVKQHMIDRHPQGTKLTRNEIGDSAVLVFSVVTTALLILSQDKE